MDNELRLLFARTSTAALTYRLAPSWGGDAGEPLPFVPFLSGDDDEDLRWYLEEYMELPFGGAEVRARRVERSLGEWGQRLFSAVFDRGDHRELFNTLADGPAPRLLTIGTKDLDVLRLPWELIADRGGPLTRRGITVRRQLESAGRPKVYETGKLPLRILLAVSRPDDTGFLDPRHTTRAMLDALAPLGEGVVVDFCRPATLDRLERMLAAAARDARPYHIVHFDGHGTFLPNSQIGALCFEKEEDASGAVNTALVRADEIGRIIAAHQIPLAILEACRSGQIGNVAAFRGVAPALLEAGVGSVLSMSHAVHVEATRVLLARFYEELAGGASVGVGLEAGRGALMANPDRWLARGPGAPTVALQDWFLPNLYQRGADPVLVPRKAKLSQKARKALEVRREAAGGGEIGAFPKAPRYGFVGRAKELHQLERRFLKHRAVLLHAMGGMGKTALAREAAAWLTKDAGMFPDGACFVSFEQAGGAVRAVQVIGGYFEGVEFEKRSGEEQRRRARELFREKRVLVVWDNFESVLAQFQEGEADGARLYGDEERAEIYRLFEEWAGADKGKGRLLVTCRPGATGLDGVAKVELAGLARADALGLLYKVMAKEGVKSYEREALVELVEAVERHPLSIELVGPHLGKMGPEEIVRDFERLLDGFAEDKAAEGRNRSLRASLEFSLKRLSPEAREAVRWLGVFRGGVFEAVLLNVSRIEAGAWEKIRGELEATALVRVERAIEMGGRHYIRFHPTLAYAAAVGEVGAEVRTRLVGVYLALVGAVNAAFRRSNPREGMDVMVREEANFRTAVGWALALEAYAEAAGMGDTLGIYLHMAGRLREQDRWAAWLAGEVRNGGFSEAMAGREIDEALAMLSLGKPREAIEQLEGLVQRLEATTEFDAGFVLASAFRDLGRVYNAVGWSQKAIPVLQDAVSRWKALIDKACAAGESTDTRRGNLSMTLGALAAGFMDAGRLDEAMTAAERATEIDRELGHHHGIAGALAQVGQILMMQGRHAEADARIDEALEAARRAGDKVQEGTVLQLQGGIADAMGQLDRAAKLYQHALRLFQEMHHDEGVMTTCNHLGVVEQKAGRLGEARAWYERSREIAAARKDQPSQGFAAQNLSIVCQQEGEAARKQGYEPRARERLTEAARFVGESLVVWRETQDEPHEAGSCSQLAQIHLLLGNLDQADAHAHRAREIYERLRLTDAWKAYDTLTRIARARGPAHEPEAAAWEQKRDALLAELRRRAGPPALPQQTIQPLAQLALACTQAGLEGAALPANAERAITTIAAWPAPLAALAPFLRALAAAETPPIPQGLPADLTAVLQQVLDAIHANIARARGPAHAPEAAAWEQKRDALRAELQHRAATPAITETLMDDLDLLSAACIKAGLKKAPLDADDQESLATIAAWPPPLSAVAPFLRALAAGRAEPVPPGLPDEMTKLLTRRAEQLRQASGGSRAAQPRPPAPPEDSPMRKGTFLEGAVAFASTLASGNRSAPDHDSGAPAAPGNETAIRTYLILPRTSAVSLASAPAPATRAERLAARRRDLTQATRGFLGRIATRAPLVIRDAQEDDGPALQSAAPLDPATVHVLKLPALGVLLATGPATLLGPTAADPDVEEMIDTADLSLEIPTPLDGGASPAGAAPWHLDAVGAPAAHAAGIDGADLWLGLADTGIDAAHPEFAARGLLYAAFDGAGKPVLEQAADGHGHGTHVAAIAAGRTVGVAPAARIAMARVFEADGRSTAAQVLAGLDWLASVLRPDGETGVDVVSLSLCSTRAGAAAYSAAYKVVVQSLRSLGIEVFGAIGNDGPGRHGSPGNYAEAIGIGAVDGAGNLWSGSGSGTVVEEGGLHKPDFLAPGVDIHAALPNGKFGLKTGTSMATPVAAGLGLLILQQQGKGVDLRTALTSRAKPAGAGPAGSPPWRACF